MASHPNDVEIRSISDDESSTASFSSPRQTVIETLQDDESSECSGHGQVTTEEMIAAAIKGGPNISDVSVDGCTNVNIGNQTHIKGTVIIRNVLTRSFVSQEIGSGANNKEIKSSSSSEVSNLEENYEYNKFGKRSKKKDAKSNSKKRKIIILSIIIVVLLVTSGIIAAILLLISSNDNNEEPTQVPTSTQRTTPTSSTSTTTISTTPSTSTTPFPLIIVERDEWKKIPNNAFKLMEHPIEEIFICHTGKLFEREFPRGCRTKDECTKFAVLLEEFYIKDEAWDDLPYNFFLGHDDLLYEGRGWKFDGAFKSAFRGDDCLSIGFIGDYSYFKPTDHQLDTLFALIDVGIESGLISENYKIFGQCQGMGWSKSPGKTLYEVTKTFEHWTNYSDVRVLNDCTFE